MSPTWCLGIGAVSLLATLAPIYSNANLDLKALDAMISMETYQVVIVALILSTIPMAFDLILDGIFGLKTSRSRSFWTARFMILVSVWIASIYMRYAEYQGVQLLVVFCCCVGNGRTVSP